jgi:hypothetical protein
MVYAEGCADTTRNLERAADLAVESLELGQREPLTCRRGYLKAILDSNVYEAAVETLLQEARHLSARLNGARLLTTLLHELERTDTELGLGTMCCGSGISTNTLVQCV